MQPSTSARMTVQVTGQPLERSVLFSIEHKFQSYKTLKKKRNFHAIEFLGDQ